MNLRRFNAAGLALYSDFVDQLAADRAAAPPAQILCDDSYSAPVAPPATVEPSREFRSRLDAGDYLWHVLGTREVDRDDGLWAWLSLLYFDQLCPRDANGERRAGERARLFPETGNYLKYCRHLLLGPFLAFRLHRDRPERAMAVLCGPLPVPGEVVAQLTTRLHLISSPQVMQAATELYYDPKVGRIRRGAAGSGSGSARRFATVLNQLGLNWYMQSVPSATICSELLPAEFAKFKQARSSPGLPAR